tara:strand:- start:964 stop:1752 length:789 start_codon:yes stop_codon:yes gene_type:complete
MAKGRAWDFEPTDYFKKMSEAGYKAASIGSTGALHGAVQSAPQASQASWWQQLLPGVASGAAAGPWGLAATGLATLGPMVFSALAGREKQKRMEGLVQQQQQMMTDIQPTLKAQAMGQESAASRAIMQRVEQQANRSRQAAAASATRSGQMGTAVARSQQADIGAQQADRLTQLLGQQQQQAMQQYMGAIVGPMQAQQQAQMAMVQDEARERQTASTFISKLFTKPPAQLTELEKVVKAYIRQQQQQGLSIDQTYNKEIGVN